MDRADAFARLLRKLAVWVEARPDLIEPLFGPPGKSISTAQADREVVEMVSRFCGAILSASASETATLAAGEQRGVALLGGASRSELIAGAAAARATFADSAGDETTHAGDGAIAVEEAPLVPGAPARPGAPSSPRVPARPDPVDAAINASVARMSPATSPAAPSKAPPAAAALDPAKVVAQLKLGNGVTQSPHPAPPGTLRSAGTVRPKRERRAAQFADELEDFASAAMLMSSAFRASRSLAKNPFDQLALRQLDRARQALQNRHLTAWPCDRPLDRPRRISGERMYELLAQSSRTLADALRRVPEPYDERPGRFKGPVREFLEESLHLTIEAQCMAKSFALSIGLPKQAPTSSHWARCGVQDAVFNLLRTIITDKGGGYEVFSELMHESAARHFGLRERRALRHRLDALRRVMDPDFDAAAAFGGAIAEPDLDEAMLEAVHDERAQEADFDTVAEAVERAREELAELKSPVVIADSALRAAEDSPFQRPDEVYEFLMKLHTLAVQWRTRGGVLGQSWDAGLRQQGYGEKLLSDTARTRFRRHYEHAWRGEKRLFEAHWTLGSRDANHCLCVHWWRDDQRREVVVGWVGRHLPNTMS